MNTSNPLHSTYGRRSFVRCTGVSLAAVIGLWGCSSPPKPTQVRLALSADVDVNPDARGRASPLTLRVYALKTTSAFEAADFFTLFDKDQATLGPELLRREELLLRPGESRLLDLTLPGDAQALAFMAAYRDLDRARWRDLVAVTPNQVQTVQVRCMARQLQLQRKA